MARFVLAGKQTQVQLLDALLREAETDDAAPVRGHEVDRLRGRELGRDRQVAFVLAVRGIDDDHELAGAEVLERLVDRREGGALLECHRANRIGSPAAVEPQRARRR